MIMDLVNGCTCVDEHTSPLAPLSVIDLDEDISAFNGMFCGIYRMLQIQSVYSSHVPHNNIKNEKMAVYSMYSIGYMYLT
jgi:ferric iron reductase protein FhuF